MATMVAMFTIKLCSSMFIKLYENQSKSIIILFTHVNIQHNKCVYLVNLGKLVSSLYFSIFCMQTFLILSIPIFSLVNGFT